MVAVAAVTAVATAATMAAAVAVVLEEAAMLWEVEGSRQESAAMGTAGNAAIAGAARVSQLWRRRWRGGGDGAWRW